MFPQGQMQAQLPVPADSLITPFLNINPQNPPFVPQLQVPPYMQTFVAYIAGCCAVEIQQTAQNNSMRCFMFNLNSQNNFMNQEFADTVAAACDYIQLQIMKRQHSDPGSAAAICVPRVIEMIAAANVYTYPGLQAYVPAQSSDAVNQLVQAFRQTGAEITQMKSAQAMQAQQPAGFVQNNNFQQQPQHAPNNFVRQAPTGVSLTGQGQQASLYGGAPAQGPAVRGPGGRVDRYASKAGQGMEEVSFEAGQPLQQPAAIRQAHATHAKAPVAKEVAPVKTNNVPAQYADHELLNVLQDGSFLIPAVDSEEIWRPNAAQPYLPAYNPSTHLLFHQIFPDGTVGIVVKELTQAMMDWKQHNMGGVFGPAAKVQKMGAKDMDEVWADVKALNHADMISDVPPVEGVDEVVPVWIDTEWKLSTSMEAAILNVRLAHQAACMKEGKDLLAFESYGSVLQITSDKEDHTAQLVRLGGVETYVGLAEKLKALKGDIPDSLWYLIDQTMTETINRVLRKNLSLGIDIERFSDDIGQLFTYVEKKGSVIFQAFQANQENTIRTALATIPEDQRKMMDEQLLAGIEGICLTYLTQETSFTVLDCMSHDLEVELQDGLAVAVLDSMVPEIYALVHGIFDRADNVEAEFARHLILTNDLKVIEVTRGHVGKDFYLMSVVN